MTAHNLRYIRSKLIEARARHRACPWVLSYIEEIEKLELELERAVDEHLDAGGFFSAPPCATTRH